MSIVGPFDPNLLGNLSAEVAVARFRELLHCEARYVGLRPDAITISANLYVPDGGIDAQVESFNILPEDTFFKLGRNGFQLKTGTTFKPWQRSSLEAELLAKSGELAPEVASFRGNLRSTGWQHSNFSAQRRMTTLVSQVYNTCHTPASEAAVYENPDYP